MPQIERVATGSSGRELRQVSGAWYKDFGSFKLCGEARYPKTFLLPGQVAIGRAL
jgi:hypothetical protein